MTADFWIAVGSMASALVAGFTGWLAWSTRSLANETRRLALVTADLGRDTVAATQAAERHHQEEMRPLLLLDAQLVVRAKTPRDRGGFDYQLSLEGDLCNFGGGPATTITLVVIPHGQVPKQFPLDIVGPNTRRELKGTQWTTFSSAPAFELGNGWPFQSVLGYSTVGFTLNVGTTKQSSVSGTAAELRVDYVNPTDNTADAERRP
jgi:hypothetical protein